ncbi:YIP1 family protein [Pseudooceanicola sediminis]|nr:YIP1 family protein [Pseudooceanicola sediminis]|tara:strand:- start:781 stop:1344 length:564 start_codon:yes stop_codon:yes gene_type:complete
MTSSWFDLARQSILNPQAAAPLLVATSLNPAVVPLTLALVAVLNGLLYGLLLPVDFFPGGFASPIVLAALVGAVVWGSAAILAVVGRMFGGTGTTTTLLRVTLWLQILRLAAQVVLSVVGMLVPALAWLIGMAAGIWGIYMMISFVAAAHGFETRLKAVGVVGVTFVSAVLVLSVLLSAMGVAPVEV